MTKKLIRKYLLDFLSKFPVSYRVEVLSELYFDVLNEISEVKVSNVKVVFNDNKFMQYGRLNNE